MFTSMIIVASTALGGADSANWPLSIETSGADVSWQSPTTVRTDGGQYELLFEVTSCSVLVSYLGLEFGPIDVTDQLPSTLYGGLVDGPCPIDGGTTSIVEPPPPDPVTIAFDISLGIDAAGYGTLLLENIVLGTATAEIPIFGEVTVNLETVYFDADVSVDVIGSSCPSDIDGNGATDVNDVLAVIAAFGGTDPDADIDQDGTVGVNDILLVIEGWGPCS